MECSITCYFKKYVRVMCEMNKTENIDFYKKNWFLKLLNFAMG